MSGPGELRQSRTAWLVAAILVVVACGLIGGQTARHGMLGHDTYPIIATARVQSFSDLAGTFTERLMDGRYPGAFYRPLLNLSFAVDYAIWGLAPLGYQLSNLALFGCCALILFALARRMSGPAAGVAPWATLITFLVYPAQIEVIPVPARRPELLCCAFMALSLWLQLSPRAMRSARAPILPALATLAAIASKESGFVLPVLTFVVVLLYAGERSPRGKLRRAVRALAPHGVVVASMLVVRFLVLGGLGGHRQFSVGEVAVAAPRYLATVARQLILPQPVMQESLAAPLVLLGLTLGLVITGVSLSLSRPQSGQARELQIRSARVLAVSILWVVAVSVTYAAAGWIGPWYLLLPAAGWSLLVGGIAERFAELARRRGEPVRWSATATLAVLVLLGAWHLRYSPLVQRYDEWRRGTEVEEEFLERTRVLVDQTPPGSTAAAPPLPFWVRPAEGAPTVFGGALLADYSVQAWADLTWPAGSVVVSLAPAPPPGQDEVSLLITSRLPGY